MTGEEKVRWRKTFFSNGVYRLKSIEFREACSRRMAERVRSSNFNPHKGFQHGWHHSNKIIGPDRGKGFYRSSYELKYFKLLDGDDAVVAYEIEPFTIEYEFLGATLNYTPDVLVYFDDGRLRLVEIKPKCQLTWDKNVAKIRAATAYCNDHQIEFATITEDDL